MSAKHVLLGFRPGRYLEQSLTHSFLVTKTVTINKQISHNFELSFICFLKFKITLYDLNI